MSSPMSPILPKRPLHPGVFLRNHFRLPLGYTQQELADGRNSRADDTAYSSGQEAPEDEGGLSDVGANPRTTIG